MPQLAYPTKMMWPRGGVADNYVFGGQSAALVADHAGSRNNGTPFYRKGGSTTTFSDLFGTRYDRSDRATMFDSDGNLVWNAHNSVTDSEDLSGDWLTQNGSISATSTTGPFGETVSNSLFIPSATSSNSHRTIANSAAAISFFGTFKIGFYVKPSGYTKIGFRNGAFSNHASWNASGAGSVIEESNCTTTITAVNNGWYYITIASDASVTALRLDLHAMDDSYASGSPGAYTFTGDGTSGAFFTRVRCYSNSLGGMATVPADVQDNGETDYVPTTGTVRFLSRREAHYYNGSAWVLDGQTEEPATTNLLLNTGTLSTQSATVTAVSHTLHFTGTGTVTLLGASTAGPLVGAGAGEENRVSLVFTPSAGSLTLTVTGTVTNAQLEVGVQTSYIPSGGSQSIRATDVTAGQVLAADVPSDTTAVFYAMHGRVTYADNAAATEVDFYERRVDANNALLARLDTSGANTGVIQGEQEAATVVDTADGNSELTPGVDVPFKFAVRHTSGAIQVANDGVAGTENSTPTALADLSTANLDLCGDFTGNVQMILAGVGDPGSAGIVEASA